MGEVVEFRYLADWHGVADSFFQAADSLATRLLVQDGDDPMPFQIIAPMLFSYRHWLELQLKAVAAVEERYDAGQRPEWGHTLMELWPIARTYMERRFGGGERESEAYDTIEANIAFMDQLDPRGETFRYPGPDRERLAEVEVDVRVLRKVMRSIHLWLSGVLDARDAQRESEDAYAEAID